MKRQVLDEKKTIKATAAKITKEANRFLLVKKEAETRLCDQLQAITEATGKVEAQMKATQKMINEGAAVVQQLKKKQVKVTISSDLSCHSTRRKRTSLQ